MTFRLEGQLLKGNSWTTENIRGAKSKSKTNQRISKNEKVQNEIQGTKDNVIIQSILLLAMVSIESFSFWFLSLSLNIYVEAFFCHLHFIPIL